MAHAAAARAAAWPLESFTTASPVDGCALQLHLQRGGGASPPLLLLLHGANLCAASFALLCGALSRGTAAPSVAVADARGHGGSGDGAALTPLSAATLAADALAVAAAAVARLRHGDGGDDGPLAVVLVGHSMGGAIATHAANAWASGAVGGALRQHARLAGIVVLDVVEEPALAALPHLRASLRSLPHSWPSAAAAVAAALDPAGGTLRLRASAELSIPAALAPCEGGGVAWRAWPFMLRSAAAPGEWEGWFLGATERLARAPCPRLLLLARLDAADAAAAAAHMMGRIELRAVAGAGHVLHEDAPDVVAAEIRGFLARHAVAGGDERELLASKLRRARGEGGARLPTR